MALLGSIREDILPNEDMCRALVSFLNAFPKRQKPKVAMVVIMFVLIAIVIAADVVYLSKLIIGMDPSRGIKIKPSMTKAKAVIIVHLILQVISAGLIICLNPIGKALNKIDTSVKLEDNDIGKIDIQD